MMRGSGALALGVLLYIPTVAHAGIDPWAVTPPAVGLGADLWSTQRALGPAVYERNPLMRSSGARVALSAAELSGVAWLSTRSRKWARITGWTVAAAHVVFAVHNERTRAKAIGGAR